MVKILAFGGSTSRQSINKRFAYYVASLFDQETTHLIDLNDFEMPIFNVDREREIGIPPAALQFRKLIADADGLIISLAEHNGSYTAAFKNILDWSSRAGAGLWMEKPMLLMATSPGRRGGKTVLTAANTYFPKLGANIVATFSLPSFRGNFSEEGITDQELMTEFETALGHFRLALPAKV
jgi:NAD(P)H-dependent FMN reductase